MATSSELAELLRATRKQTLALIDGLADEAVERQIVPYLSPLAWDLGHLASFEEQWLVRRTGGRAMRPDLDPLYAPELQPRPSRGALPVLTRAQAIAYLEQVREAALERLERTDLDDGDPLHRDGQAWRMVAQHECQHRETMLQALDLPHTPAEASKVAMSSIERDAPPTLAGDATLLVLPSGVFEAGTSDRAWAYDNERPAREMHVGAFAIESAPVSCRQWAAFVDDGGYRDARWWTPAGDAWRRESEAAAPQGWERSEGSWSVRRFGRRMPLDLREPVQHVCAHEADAFARWSGARLPTEWEWERAMALELPLEAAFGSVYQWTSSELTRHDGFEPFPYPGYSEVHMDRGYRVLRGTSWAVGFLLARRTYRNWDLPERRQVFAGVRLAREA